MALAENISVAHHFFSGPTSSEHAKLFNTNKAQQLTRKPTKQGDVCLTHQLKKYAKKQQLHPVLKANPSTL